MVGLQPVESDYELVYILVNSQYIIDLLIYKYTLKVTLQSSSSVRLQRGLQCNHVHASFYILK